MSIKIDEDIKARVKRLAESRQRTSHWLKREAITQYVDREEKREAFRQGALKAWEEYRATGLSESLAWTSGRRVPDVELAQAVREISLRGASQGTSACTNPPVAGCLPYCLPRLGNHLIKSADERSER
ncbi:putative transcriptional regulator [Variovorax boronicumulans]|uniref:Transcriptional regulator n=1 Tax=Variovorax boronicumulans TaxID=436515 RepID=A0AAW8DUB3_9BURK|nr:ribbon-helix-helix protein, CopG family [Variovorax boronicumulans]MDP9877617.1 putative transcriptional regulator [Variovorax boronicumulans]MDP9922902.1 putative transcriptional regulator [Variovorax boronicumulans]